MILNLFPAGANLSSSGEVILWGYLCDPMNLWCRGKSTHEMVASLKRSPPCKADQRRPLAASGIEIDPLTCPKCQGPMAIIAFIEAEDVIEKILKHLGLWELTPRPPPRSVKSQPLSTEPHIDYPDSQVPFFDNWFYVDPIPACA